MTDIGILRTKFRERLQAKTSWGRNEILLILEESIGAMLDEQLGRMYEAHCKEALEPIRDKMESDPF